MKSRKKKKIIKSKLEFWVILLIFIYIIFTINYLKKTTQKSFSPVVAQIVNDTSKPKPNFETERMKNLKELQKENSDIVAWLQIEDTNINYPVLQGKDNKFYMTHTYEKKYSRNGSLFLDKDYNWNLPSTNLLIYGHNKLASKEMFSDLMKYKKEDFYNNHKTIRLTTANEDANYEIISVFLSKVYYKSDTNVFRYYFFINADNAKEFNTYIDNCKKASLYDIEATAQYGDQLLTLSTCSYHTKDGRLAVVARKIN